MPSSPQNSSSLSLALLGPGRLGHAIARALAPTSVRVAGPYGRDDDPYADLAYPDIVLLCVPDAEIAGAAAQFPDSQMLGHCSGATGLEALGAHPGFSLHPLTTITGADAQLQGVGAAIDGTDDTSVAVARSFAETLGMRPFRIAAADRPAYHAAASIAANFLITLEAAAEQMADSAGLDRRLLVPLVRASVENWARLGAARALTGPVARGDAATVARQREAVAARAPQLLQLFDTMVAATEALAGSTEGMPA